MAFLIVRTGFFVSSTYAAAGINQTINFQGKLVGNTGLNVADGNYDIVFYLYAASSGGSPLWTETWNSGTTQVAVQDGIFRVALGTHSTFSAFDFNTDSLYLAIKVGADSEMTPRIRFTSVPYAFVAKTVVDDALDFAQLQDTLDLDANLTVNQTGYTWTQTYTGTSAPGLSYTSSGAVTSGNAATLDINASNASTTVPAMMLTNAGSGFALRINDDGTTTDSTPLVVDANGNVGIGTTSPTGKLTISSSQASSLIPFLQFVPTGTAGINTVSYFGGASNKAGELMAIGDYDSSAAPYHLYYSESNGANPALVDAWQTSKSSVTQTNADIFFTRGSVGIGTTTPTQKLHVDGSLRVTGALYDSSNSAGSSNYILSSTGTGTAWTNLSASLLPSGTEGQTLYNNAGTWTANSGLYYDDVNGRVGIGTTAPGARLEVIGSVANAGSISFEATNGRPFLVIKDSTDADYSYLQTEQVNGFSISSRAVGADSVKPLYFSMTDTQSPVLYMSPTGNVGIGGLSAWTTPSLYVAATGNVGIGTTSPKSSLEIAAGQVLIPDGTAATPSLGFGSSTYPGGIGIYKSATHEISIASASNAMYKFSNTRAQYEAPLILNNVAGGLQFSSSSVVESRLYRTASNTLTLDNNAGGAANLNITGNLGIGTTGPATKLDAYGTIRASNSASNYIQISHDGSNPQVYFNGGNGAIFHSAGGYNLMLGNSGNVSVGGLLQPSKFNVYGNATIGTNYVVGGYAAPTNGLLVEGNVGIGTSTPYTKLDVAGVNYTSNSALQLSGSSASTNIINDYASLLLINTNQTNGNYTSIQFTDATNPANQYGFGGVYGIFTNHAQSTAIRGDIAVVTRSSDGYLPRLYVQSGGNVGIGTTAPSSFGGFASILDIAGAAPALVLHDTDGASEDFQFGAEANVLYMRDSGQTIMTLDATANGVGVGYDTVGTAKLAVNGNVGIGTTAPGALLDVAGTTRLSTLTGKTNGVLYLSSTNGDVAATATGGAGTLCLISTAGGVPAWGSCAGSASSVWSSLTAPSADLSLNMGTYKTGFTLANSTTAFNFKDNATNSLLNLDGANGRVGIGTTAPTQKLDVAGSLTLGGGESILFTGTGNKIVNASATDLGFQTSNQWNVYLATGGNVGIGGTAANSAPTLFATSAGNVGIGTTNPLTRLSVLDASETAISGVTGGTSKVGVYGSSGTAAAYGVMGFNNSTAGVGILAQQDSTGYALYALGGKNYFSGNVGIGTTAPGGQLSIKSPGSNSAPFTITNSSGFGMISVSTTPTNKTSISMGDIDQAANGTYLILSDSGSSIDLSSLGLVTMGDTAWNGNGNIFTIDDVNSRFTFQTGNVGIGTTAPTSKLHVGGIVTIGAQTNSASTGSSTTSLNATPGTFGGASAIDKIASSIVYRNKLFVATAETNNAGVYRYDGGTTWTLVTNAAGKAVSGDATDADAFIMTVYNDKLFIANQTGAATGAIYYSSTADTTADSFTMLNATRGTSGMSQTTITGYTDMKVFQGRLFVATQLTNAAEIGYWVSGTTFTQVNATDGKAVAETTADKDGFILQVYNGMLFSGGITGSTTASVASYNGSGTTWVMLNTSTGGGTLGAESSYVDITSMTVFNGNLYVAASKTDAAAVYMYKQGVVPVTNVAANFLRVNTTVGKLIAGDTANIDSIVLRVYNGRLYAASSTGANSAALYEYPGGGLQDWTLMTTTRGTFGSDTNVDGISTLIEFNGDMYLGSNETNVASVYTWTKVANNSYQLRFDAGSQNYGTINFVGNTQENNNSGNTGSFNFSNAISLSSGSFDYAEDYPTTDTTLVAGEIVSIDPDIPEHVQRAHQGESILGVISTNPGFRLSSNADAAPGAKWVPIALVGRVPVKVSSENGPIRIGDNITVSTTPGMGTKATQSGMIIGQALSAFEGEGTGEITIFIKNSYAPAQPQVGLNSGGCTISTDGSISCDTTSATYHELNSIGLIPIVAKAIQDQRGLITTTQSNAQVPDAKIATVSSKLETLNTKVSGWDGLFISIQSIIQTIQETFITLQNQLGLVRNDITETKEQVASLSASLTTLTSWKEAISSGELPSTTGAILGATDSAALGNVATASSLLVKNNLQVEGKTTAFDLTVLNKLTTGVIELGAGIDGDEINASTGIRFQTLAQGPVDFMNGKVIIDVDGSISAKHFKLDTLDTASSTGGKGIMPAGEMLTTVETTSITAGSMVYVTIQGDYAPATRYWVTNQIPGASFMVEFDRPTTNPVEFNWFIIN